MEVRNRFKGLDLIDRVPDELWTEVCDIVQGFAVAEVIRRTRVVILRLPRSGAEKVNTLAKPAIIKGIEENQ